MALGTLADLEELHPTPRRPSPEAIFKNAIEVAQKHYQNKHVYPYTYLGSHYRRRGFYKYALQAWADASEVISQ